MYLPRWRDMPDVDKAAAVEFLQTRMLVRGEAIHDSPCLYREHPTLVELSPLLACNHAITLYPHVRALPQPERKRLLDLARPSQEGPRHARPAA